MYTVYKRQRAGLQVAVYEEKMSTHFKYEICITYKVSLGLTTQDLILALEVYNMPSEIEPESLRFKQMLDPALSSAQMLASSLRSDLQCAENAMQAMQSDIGLI